MSEEYIQGSVAENGLVTVYLSQAALISLMTQMIRFGVAAIGHIDSDIDITIIVKRELPND